MGRKIAIFVYFPSGSGVLFEFIFQLRLMFVCCCQRRVNYARMAAEREAKTNTSNPVYEAKLWQ